MHIAIRIAYRTEYVENIFENIIVKLYRIKIKKNPIASKCPRPCEYPSLVGRAAWRTIVTTPEYGGLL